MNGAAQTGSGPAWMSRMGIAAVLFGVLFTAYAGNSWMRELVIERMAPPGLELPAANCPAEELEEEGISVAECEQLVSDARSYIVSRPDGFATRMAWVMGLGTLLAVASIVCGAGLVNYRGGAARVGAIVFAALAVVDAGYFVVAQQAGPILRGLHLPVALLWFLIHLAFAMAFHVARREEVAAAAGSVPADYNRFEVATHWFIATSVFFLFVSSWWMLSLPLPSSVFRFREFPFQLHKNLGITIFVLLATVAVIRLLSRRALSAVPGETPSLRRLRVGGHIALYVLILLVCITGFMSSTYSGWGTTWWWLIDLPYWGRDDEELNQLYSDLHLWACWGLLLAMAAHVGAALSHAFRNDGVIRRIMRW